MDTKCSICGRWTTLALTVATLSPASQAQPASSSADQLAITPILLLLLACTLAAVLFVLWQRRVDEAERERLAAIVESSQDAIIGKDPTGRITSWNRGAEQLYGYTRDEMIGRDIRTIVPERHIHEVDDFLAKVARGERVESYETERRTKDGTVVPVSLTISPIRDRAGNVTGASVIARNVTRIRRTEERLETALKASPVGMILADADGIIHDINPAGLALFGYDELVGEPIEKLIPERWRNNHERFRANFMKAPSTRPMGEGRDLSGLRQDGSQIPVEIALTPLPGGDLIMASVVNIAERKRWEKRLEEHMTQLERSNRELDSFAYVASHDLKSPLRGIQNLCRFIEEDLGDAASDEVREHLELMQGRVARMERLLDDLLAYSRVGRVEETIVEIGVHHIIGDILETLDVPDGFTIEQGALPTLVTHRPPLEQVLRNLIQNAIKHHDRESGTVRIFTEPADNDMIVFTVADDGPGIPRGFEERIFRMFTTLAPRDRVEGSGLGLSLVQKLVEHYGGHVWLEDTAGERGATFRFTWPRSLMKEAV